MVAAFDEDASFVAALRDGDQQAFSQLVRHHHRALLAGDLNWREGLPFLHGPASDDEVDKVITRVQCDRESHHH